MYANELMDFIETHNALLLRESHTMSVQSFATNTLPLPLPNGRIKWRRRWGQRHPQGANSGFNGKLEVIPNAKRLPPAHPNSLLANVYQASPLRPAMC
jgi:hypothetical protein